MKKLLSFMITALAVSTLVSGQILSVFAAEINRNTGIAIHDNAPVLTADNLDEFLKYFENTEDYVVMPDITDPRNTYEERLAKEAAETLQRVGKGINEFYNEQYALTTYLSDFVNDNIDKYNETADFTNMILIFFLPFNSWEMSMGATFNETSDWAMVSSGVSQAFSFMGGSNVEVIRNDAHDYTVTYTNDEGENITNYFKGNPEHGFQMLSYKGETLNEILEYIHKDENTYIWQSSNERLVVDFDGEKINRCTYTKLSSEDILYNEDDLIFADFSACDYEWPTDRKEYGTKIIYDGETIKVTATAFLFGGLCEGEITDVIMPKFNPK